MSTNQFVVEVLIADEGLTPTFAREVVLRGLRSLGVTVSVRDVRPAGAPMQLGPVFSAGWRGDRLVRLVLGVRGERAYLATRRVADVMSSADCVVQLLVGDDPLDEEWVPVATAIERGWLVEELSREPGGLQ